MIRLAHLAHTLSTDFRPNLYPADKIQLVWSSGGYVGVRLHGQWFSQVAIGNQKRVNASERARDAWTNQNIGVCSPCLFNAVLPCSVRPPGSESTKVLWKTEYLPVTTNDDSLHDFEWWLINKKQFGNRYHILYAFDPAVIPGCTSCLQCHAAALKMEVVQGMSDWSWPGAFEIPSLFLDVMSYNTRNWGKISHIGSPRSIPPLQFGTCSQHLEVWLGALKLRLFPHKHHQE